MTSEEIEPQPKVTILEMSEQDVEEEIAMRMRSWIYTYINDDAGVSREWVEAHIAEKLDQRNEGSRKERFQKAKEKGTFNAWVAKDRNGKIVGSTTPFVDEGGHQHVGSLYVDKDWHGKGVGKELMQQVIDWFDPSKPIELMVVTYNDRAKTFYRKWEFEEVPGSEDLFDGKLPEIKMIRPATK